MPCGGCGCGGCSQTICVKDCTGAPVNGASITIKNGSTTIATGTTGDPSNCSVASTIRVAVGSGYTSVPTVSFSGGGGSGAAGIAVRSSGGAISAVTITNQGSGYSSAPTILFSGGGGSGANYTAVLGCGCVTLSLPSSGVYTVIVSSSSVNVTATLELSCSTITIGGFCANVNVLDCLISGLKVPGVTVTATGPSTSTNTYSAITDVNGCAIIPLPSSGTYTFSATYNGTTATYTGAAINGGTTDCASVIDITVTFANLCIRINGCFGIGNPLQGATVTVTGIGTVISDVHGNACFFMAGGTPYTYSASYRGFTTATGSIGISTQVVSLSCFTSVNLTAASGYVCCSNCCNEAICNTLDLTDSVFGATTLFNGGSGCTWIGTITYAFPGAFNCPPASVIITYEVTNCGLSVRVGETIGQSLSCGAGDCPPGATLANFAVAGGGSCSSNVQTCGPFDEVLTCTTGGAGSCGYNANSISLLWGAAGTPVTFTVTDTC